MHFADHLCIVAMRIGLGCVSHPLTLVERSTENTTLVRGLLVELREPGSNVTRPILVVLDEARMLSTAVLEVFEHPVIQACQIHGLRNVQEHLPLRVRKPGAARVQDAYHAESALAG